MEDLAKSLHPLERKVLPVLKETLDINKIIAKTGLKEVEVLRALQWLANKNLVELSSDFKEMIVLGENGIIYKEKGLPEKQILKMLSEKPRKISEIHLSMDEIGVSIGSLKKKNAITTEKKGEDLVLIINDEGKKLLKKESFGELFLKSLPKELRELKPDEKLVFEELKKRRDIIRVEAKKIWKISLTVHGKKLVSFHFKEDLVESLTYDMLKTGSWKDKEFRTYDLKAYVPRVSGGKRHFVNQAMQFAKKIWIEMGFKEMTGPIINTSFWNFDALFTAQNHPVRDMQDTFFIKDPAKGKLPDAKLIKTVQAVHEDGWDTGSKGWQYQWNEEEAKKNVLRTHTTVLSARTLSKLKKSDLPAKYFAVGKCFRNETLDWCHLFEFNQTEGIVIDPNANFKHLLGYLKNFFTKMGYPKARFRPAFFPYTSHSVEIDVFHPIHKKWVELGGAGIFRPEVVKPLLGEEVPVLAWGPGFDRIYMEYYKITDIRDLYRNDIKQIKEARIWLK